MTEEELAKEFKAPPSQRSVRRIGKLLGDALSRRQREIVKKMRNHLPVSKPFVNTEGKVGRNDLCPCGSGLKYKKCCMLKGSEHGSQPQ